MKCKKHRRYDGKKMPIENCLLCWHKYFEKGAVYEDVLAEFERRVAEDPSINVEPAFYEYEDIDNVTWCIRGYIWSFN